MSFKPIPTERLPGGRIDPELGPVRTCARCQEEWPHDPEFFVTARYRTDGVAVLGTICKACSLEGFWRRMDDPRAAAL